MFSKELILSVLTVLHFSLGMTCFVAETRASETDGFTFRYTDFESGIPAISKEVDRRMSAGIAEANRHASCSPTALEKAMKSQFLRPLYGKIEGWINSTPAVPKKHIPLDESVYKYIRFESNIPAHLGLMGFGNIIRDGVLLIGTDKFGHFFDEGFHYYKAMRDDGVTLDEAMNYGDSTENGIFGLETTGVKSYADMTTNFNGVHFWSDLLSPVIVDTEYRPYAECKVENNKREWVQVRKFDFNDYIDPAWDEGINCDQFRNDDYAAKVDHAIRELEAADPAKRRFQCPALPDECLKAKEKYGRYAVRLLHPKCLNP